MNRSNESKAMVSATVQEQPAKNSKWVLMFFGTTLGIAITAFFHFQEQKAYSKEDALEIATQMVQQEAKAPLKQLDACTNADGRVVVRATDSGGNIDTASFKPHRVRYHQYIIVHRGEVEADSKCERLAISSYKTASR